VEEGGHSRSEQSPVDPDSPTKRETADGLNKSNRQTGNDNN